MGKKIPKTSVHYKIDGQGITATLELELDRFDGQFTRAQWKLDSQVMSDMEKFMPKQTGTFINVTKAMSAAIAGSGKVIAAAPPMGRFLYKGKVMVDEKTGSAYARKGANKILVSQYTGKTNAKDNLDFSKSAHPNATPEWFEEAKKSYGKSWINQAKKIAGGG